MRLVVWNSFGAKWDDAYTYFTAPQFTPGQDVVLMLVESGWAPWVLSHDVHLNGLYALESDSDWYNHAGAAASTFCTGVKSARRNRGFWVPWVGNLNAMKTNSRCSMGSAVFPGPNQLANVRSFNVEGFTRPLIRMDFGKSRARGVDVDLVVLLVHMISGYPARAREQLIYVMSRVQEYIPEGADAVVVGDMNVNILGQQFGQLPDYWRVLRTGVATQQSGGELDYALVYDPRRMLAGATVGVVQQFKTGNNRSDHSVLLYNIPMR